MRVGLALALVGASALFCDCDSGGTECVCPAVGLTVTLPTSLAGGVAVFTPSGAACQGAKVTCSSSNAASCASYRVTPVAAGDCLLTLDFNDGTSFTDDLTVVSTTGCCAGLRADPPSAADIDVPSPDAGVLDAADD